MAYSSSEDICFIEDIVTLGKSVMMMGCEQHFGAGGLDLVLGLVPRYHAGSCASVPSLYSELATS